MTKQRTKSILTSLTILAALAVSAFAAETAPIRLEGKFGRVEINPARPELESLTLRRADGTLVNCSSDYITGVSVDIVGEHKLTFSAGSHLSHHLGLRVREKGAVVAVNGVWIQCSSAPTIQVEGGRSIAVTGCTLDRRHESFGAPAVMIGGGEIVSITGNAIDSQGTGLHLRPGCERLVYSSNAVRFKGMPVTDESGGKGRLVLQGNAEEPITAKTPEAAPPAKQ